MRDGYTYDTASQLFKVAGRAMERPMLERIKFVLRLSATPNRRREKRVETTTRQT